MSIQPRPFAQTGTPTSAVLAEPASDRAQAESRGVRNRSKNTAENAASIGTPSKCKRLVDVASNVPRPNGMGPKVTTIDARIKAMSDMAIDAFTPNP
jgi:hypothetical protein